MAITALDLAAVASSLRGTPSEPNLRSATSRLYYAVLQRCVEVLIDTHVGFARPTAGTYRAVSKELTNGTAEISIATMLGQLKSLRENADYDIHTAWPAWRQSLAEGHAKILARRLDQLHVPSGTGPLDPAMP